LPDLPVAGYRVRLSIFTKGAGADRSPSVPFILESRQKKPR